MKKQKELPTEIAELQLLAQHKDERIAYIEKLLSGSKKDKVFDNGPNLFYDQCR
ncbi:MAG: hypothetical protein ACRCZY_00030 [Phocaeicola sp.]